MRRQSRNRVRTPMSVHKAPVAAAKVARGDATHTRAQMGLAALLVLAAFSFFMLTAGAAKAMKIQEVTSPGGIKAWLVEERTVPLIALRFGFRGGSTQDPEGKEGLSNLLTAMMDEGAGDLTAQDFQERQQETAMKMAFTASRDFMSGSFQTLAERRDESVELFRLAMSSPRFDADALERMRKVLSSGLIYDARNPNTVAGLEWFKLAFAGHPYARPLKGTIDSLKNITPEDLHAYKKNVFARDNLTVSVVGAISPEELGVMLDKMFGGLPEKANLVAVPEAKTPVGPVQKIIKMPVPQSVATFGHAGVKRDDKDFVPAYLLNYIIGGGGFNSRLMEEVREKRGLAYSVYSYLNPMESAALYMGGVATKNSDLKTSLDVIRSVLTDIADNGPTMEELETAKKYQTGSYALRFDTSSKIAGQLLWIQIEELGIDYVDRRNAMIDEVTFDDIKRVAKRLLKPGELIVTVVGNPEGLKTDG